MTESMALQIQMNISYQDAIEQVTGALKSEGFGILTRIDVKATIKEKLNEDFRPYIILGACNPSLAYGALKADALAGIMLPCNVTVEENEGKVLVSIANPKTLIGVGDLAENPALQEIMQQAYGKLQRVAGTLEKIP
jgi:uncharacterized protein (DUF302 family)